jgi:Transglycosylase-like domain
MRRLMAAVASIAVIGAPAAIALAAESGESSNEAVRRSTAGLAEEGNRQIRSARAELTAERRKERRRRRAAGGAASGHGSVASPQLQAIAACESGGNPRAIGGGGLYRGKYQFDRSTWASVGGSGDPAAAPEAEQDRRAAMLLARAGTSPWPVCGG